MKKRIITILLLTPFWANAQIELSESYAFKQDKVYHVLAGTGISVGTFIFVNNKTNDIDLAFRAAWMSSAFAALGKEIYDCSQGKEVSLADMSYTIASGLLTAYAFKIITKHRRKKKIKKFNDFWDLDNEFINE
jgi:hypothetical protein